MEVSLRIVHVLLLILVAITYQREVLAAKHEVGGSQGWDESTDFDSWASSNTFKVGDQLEFKYTTGLHSVVELGSESAYKSCDIGSAVNSMNGGSDTVKLDKAGTRYFACGTSGHCQQGMKVKITTVAADGSSSSSSSTTTTTPTAAHSSSMGTSHQIHLLGHVLAIIGTLVVFFEKYNI